jgi:uncharacterized damage-inducible protein DinB
MATTSAVHTILASVERDREALYASVADVGAAEIDVRPAPDAWSVCEVLDHLHRVEAGIAKLLAVRVGKGRAAGTLLPAPDESEEAVAAAMAAFETYATTMTSGRLQAPETVCPQAGRTKDELLAALRSSREALVAAALDGAAYDLGAMRHPHPSLGDIDLRQWLQFVGRHERRHMAQIAVVRRSLAEGAGVER